MRRQRASCPARYPTPAYLPLEAMSEQSSLATAVEAVLRQRGEQPAADSVGDDGLPPVKVDVVRHPIQPPSPDDLTPEG